MNDDSGLFPRDVVQVRSLPRPEPARGVAAVEDAIDCREALVGPAGEIAPGLQPLRALLDACRDDPARFQEEVLGRRLWSKQVEVCRAIAESPITVVPAGRAVGKSFLLAGTVLWWLYTRPNSLVITTGPDHRQVVSVLWKEIRRALNAPARFRNGEAPSEPDSSAAEPRPPRFMQHRSGHRGAVADTGGKGVALELGYDHLTAGYSSPQRLCLKQGTSWGALGFAAQYEEGFSGQHAADLLVIVDEASGVTEAIWSAIHGLAGSRLVVAGNPIRYDCHFRELHDLAEKGSSTIRTIRISSLESPDAAREFSPVGMASRTFLSQMREIHGEESPWWRSNILGIFPGQESVRFLPSAWLDACTREQVPSDELWKEYPAGSAFMGVDLGGGVGADRSVVVVRNNKQLLEIFASEWYGVLDDARHRLEPVVVDMARRWQVAPDRVVYDKAGIGRSFGSYLAGYGIDGAVGYFGAGKGGKLHVNRRTANAFAIKRRLDPHRESHVPFYCGGLPEWPALRQELAELRSPTMEVEEGQVKQVLEDKEELAARLHRSPDLLDALLMTFTYSE